MGISNRTAVFVLRSYSTDCNTFYSLYMREVSALRLDVCYTVEKLCDRPI